MDLDSPGEEVDRSRLQCLKSWTEKRLNALVISLPERDPYRLLCEILLFDASAVLSRLATFCSVTYPRHCGWFGASRYL